MKSVPVLLLVEDNLDDIELTQVALEETRLVNQLVVVHDGQEALDWLRCVGKYESRNPCLVPSLVLLDLHLPRVDGLEVLRQVRADIRTRRIPVAILTSSKEERDITGGYELGANSYIQKPVDFSQFVDVIRQLGIYWMVLNEPPPHIPRGA